MAILALVAGCGGSPNRGRWEGTFAGGVSGTMVFTINTDGTRAEGEIDGTTRDGQEFQADFEGSLNVDYLRATFRGSSAGDLGLRASFEGELDGTLVEGRAEGRWKVRLTYGRAGYEGAWTAVQIP